MLHHVVMFRFHEQSDSAAAVERLRGMAGRIPALRALRVGQDVSGGPASYHVVLISEHDSAQGLADYLADPVHREVAAWLAPRVAERAVVDTTSLA